MSPYTIGRCYLSNRPNTGIEEAASRVFWELIA